MSYPNLDVLYKQVRAKHAGPQALHHHQKTFENATGLVHMGSLEEQAQGRMEKSRNRNLITAMFNRIPLKPLKRAHLNKSLVMMVALVKFLVQNKLGQSIWSVFITCRQDRTRQRHVGVQPSCFSRLLAVSLLHPVRVMQTPQQSQSKPCGLCTGWQAAGPGTRWLNPHMLAR